VLDAPAAIVEYLTRLLQKLDMNNH